MNARLTVITNRPRSACLALAGCWPAPAWLGVATTPEQVAALGDDAPAISMLYGEGCMRTVIGHDGKPHRKPLTDPLAIAAEHFRARACRYGLTLAQIDWLSAQKARLGKPGVLASFSPGLRERLAGGDAHLNMAGRVVSISGPADAAPSRLPPPRQPSLLAPARTEAAK